MSRKDKGQASIMMGMMMLTFILFFAFVTNTGMLVNAKINLQNAADLAAYAGAAVQARQLTTISYLNYEMRRQYKKYLFRYYIIGNEAQDFAPPAGGNSGPRKWMPSNQSSVNYQVPAVCLTFNPQDNYCHIPSNPHIQFPNFNSPLDAINQALSSQLQALEQIRQANCASISNLNLQVLLLWLYNTDPQLQNLKLNLPQEQQKALDVIRGVSTGLGLVPREILLHQRIQTLKDYVNFPPKTGLKKSDIDALVAANDQQAGERQIQAFLSAYNTLGNHIYSDDNSITMDELMPPAMLDLQDVKIDFDNYAVVYETVNAAGVSSNASDCIAKLTPITVRAMPIGVAKNPSTLTYYAIRLTGKAQVLFSPFGDVTMKAYAAARPFGSRIGPPITAKAEFTRPFTLPVSAGLQNTPGTLVSSFIGGSVLGSFANAVPNLPVLKGDSSGTGQGWDNYAVDAPMANMLQQKSGPGGVVDNLAAESAYNVAMGPNEPEGGRYNIISDNAEDEFVRNFDSTHQAVVWAPVVSPDKLGQASQVLQTAIQALFAPDPASTQNTMTGQNILPQLQAGVTTDLLNYVQSLQQGAGENGEGMFTYRFDDPFFNKVATSTSPPGPVTLGAITMTDPTDYRSSFVGLNDSQITSAGRIGYSVKIVSFDSLTKHASPVDMQGTTATNAPILDDEASRDVSSLKH